MAGRTLRQRIDAAFSDPRAEEFGDKYLEMLLANAKEVDAALRRTVLIILLAGTAFELLVAADVEEFALGPFKVNDVSFAPALLPPLVSFLAYELFMLAIASWRLYEIRHELVRKLYPTLHENELAYSLAPPTLSPWGAHEWRKMRVGEGGRAYRVLENITGMLGFAMLVAPFPFLFYAYWRLLDASDASLLVIWVGLAVSVVNALRVIVTFVDEMEASPGLSDPQGSDR